MTGHTTNPAPLPVARPRLFLSYGRRDAAPLADRLRADLETHGFEVWQDTQHIRTGKEWEEEIKDGLRSTQVVVALLSPHAVRQSLDPQNPDNIDSVCLDEISFARFAQQPKPILPVMAISCEPPFCIFRLDYTDMRQWAVSEERYRDGFERLLSGLAAVLRGEPTRYRRWHHYLPSLDFSGYLHEKRQDFVGRQWLFDKVDAWRTASGKERALLLTGDPGTGKTSFIAEMVHRNPSGQVLAYHCCIADDRQTLDPAAFVLSVAAMIASRLPHYADLLDDPKLQEIFNIPAVERNPGGAFDRGILHPLEHLSAPVDGVRLILVDALDEALLGRYVSDNLVTMLASRLERLPDWLRIVATTRKERDIFDQLGSLRAETIDAQTSENLSDLTLFVNSRLATPNLAERLTASRVKVADVQRRLQEAGGGNFLFVKMALQDIERDQSSFVQLEELPRGLSSIYRRFFGRLFTNPEESYRSARSVLEVMVAAYEPLTFDLLAKAAGLDSEYELPGVLGTLSSFIENREGKYSLYHKSLADWLTNTELRGSPYYASRKRGHQTLAEACFCDYRRSLPGMDRYSLRYLPAHLAVVERWDEIASIISDISMIEAIISAGFISELIIHVPKGRSFSSARRPEARSLCVC